MNEDGMIQNAASASPPPSDGDQGCRFRSWAATHQGTVRTHNEDTFVNRPDLGLWAVADGAGGHQSGEVASKMVADALETIPPALGASEILAQVRLRVGAAHQALREEAERRGPRAMLATTLVVLIARGDHFACLWAGDSRIYLMRQGTLTQVTRDHSLVQELVDAGHLRPEEAEGHPRANVITRAVGADGDEFELEKLTERLQPGDRFLLCSDGLCKTLADSEMAALLAAPDGVPPPELLLTAALAQQATDNVTAVTVEVY